MGGIYNPTNSQASAQYGVSPFQRFEISMNVDRTQGEFFPQPEGATLYIDQADYPATITLIAQAGNPNQALYAKAGAFFCTRGFKGFTIQHPNLTIAPTLVPKIAFLVGKDASAVNEYAQPNTPSGAFRSVVNTAVAQSISIFIPPNTKRIERIYIPLVGTTYTNGTWNIQALGPSSGLTIVFWPTVTLNGVAYNANSQLVGQMRQSSPVSGNFNLEEGPIQLPSYASPGEFAVNIVGTGLNLPIGIEAIFS